MTATTLYLQLGDKILDLLDTATNGFSISIVDLGSPTIRAAVTDLPNQDGQYDVTEFFGSRVVALTAVAVKSAQGSPTKAADLLAPFLWPQSRPSLVYSLAGDTEQRVIGLRSTQWSDPMFNPKYTQWTVQWVAPDPIAYSTVAQQVDIGTGTDAGRTYSRTYPRVYPPSSSATGIGVMTIGGTYPTYPVLRIFGPVTNPAVTWLDPITSIPNGPVVGFTGITVAAGDYLEVDMRAHTARLNGDPNANRFSSIDFANTNWDPVDPGAAAARFSGTSTNSNTLCSVFWNTAWLQ